MVNKLNNLIAKTEIEKGELLLFMLWKNLPQDNTWSVIISAEWIEKIGQSAALQYWITKIRGALPAADLSRINRVSFLKPNDRVTKLITSTVRVVGSPITFSKNQVAELFIEEAVIFRARKISQKKLLNSQNRNPIFNHNINPIFNHNINPIFNHNINPIFNHNINPIFNHNINPIFNHNINPIFNPNFTGYYLYNTQTQQTAYLVQANDEIILMFNNDSNLQAIGIKNSINGFTIFDSSNNWIGTMIPDTQGGFIFYSQSNQQIGYV